MANEMANQMAVRSPSGMRNRLIVLGVLIAVLLLVFVLLTRKASQPGQQISGTSFTITTILYDLKVPLGVAFDEEENIYVSNTGAGEIAFYDSEGSLKFALDQIVVDDESVDIASPYGIAVDDERDKVYIVDNSNVKVLDRAGNFKYFMVPPPEAVQLVPGEGAPRPNGIALYEDKVYVTSRDGIYVFSAEDGSYVDHWGKRGPEVGNYNFPNGIAVDQRNGNIYVVDTVNWRVVALTPEGKPRWTLGSQDNGQVTSPFRLPRSIAVGPDGTLYVSDQPDRIIVLDGDGKLLSIIGERGTEEAQLNFPEGLAVSSSNKLIFADRENNRVQVWQIVPPLPDPSTADVEKFGKALRNV